MSEHTTPNTLEEALDVIDKLWDRIERLELSRDAAHKRIDQLEEKLDGNSENAAETQENDDTPLEQIADEEQENPTGVRVSESVTRAACIMKNWTEWTDKAPIGRVVKKDIRARMEGALGESLAWNQIYRAFRKVEQLTKGKIIFTEAKRTGRKILLQSSSAGES